jgi:membrane-bound inhibitor of C-type lysozyme
MRHVPPSRPMMMSAACAAALAALLLAACAAPPSKEEQEAAKNTFACTSAGERIVIRVDVGEARLLMPDGDRVSLYQIPAGSGVRYSNGNVELRGKGMDLELVRLGVATPLKDCQPYLAPK